ncbi:MAG: ATP-binding cassette domain-containing protein, partial [Albidovulum sp.]
MSLDLAGITVRLRHGAALFPPLSLSVAAGEVATVMGPSGIGKSTLLDALGGHLPRRFEMTGR